MFERSDGTLVEILEDNESKGIRVSILDLVTKTVTTVIVSPDDVRTSLGENVDLLNPHRLQERHSWLAEHMNIRRDTCEMRGSHLTSVRTELVATEQDKSFKLPMGTMSSSERERMRNEITSVDAKRELQVAEIENTRHSRFQEYLRCLREKQAARIEEEGRRLNEAQTAQIRENKEREEMETKAAEARLLIEQRRGGNVAERHCRQITYQDNQIDRILRDANAKKSERSLNVISWKEKRKADIAKSRQEEKAFFEEMAKMEAKRDQAFNERELRWQAKSQAYLQERRDKLNLIQRKKIVLKEKRQAQAHELFSSQPIPV